MAAEPPVATQIKYVNKSNLSRFRTKLKAELEEKSNKVTSISSTSTDEQYPSAKCVYDLIGDIESLLSEV